MSPRAQSPHVPAQYYGYSLQCTYFVRLLLQANKGTLVSLEVIEDVASHAPSGDSAAVQIKSGQRTNPVSDRSPGLWKTFANWIAAVQCGEIEIGKTSFEIHVNTARKGSIVSRFSDAISQSDAASAIAFAREHLVGKKQKLDSEIEALVSCVLSPQNEAVTTDIITRFTLTHGSGEAFADLLDEFKKALIDEDVAEDVLLYVSVGSSSVWMN